MTAPDSRLQLLYDVAHSVTTFTELDPLLRYVTRRARELLKAEGCAVLLLDETRERLFFPVESQAESREGTAAALEEVSFPAHRGVAGWVMRENQAALVEDASSDPRVYGGVDQVTGMVTRAILCAPLRTRAGNVGVLEVVNPLEGRFDADDLAFLQALASDVAIACEKARLYDRLRRETVALRKVCRAAGLAVAAVGAAFAAGAVYAQLARALPLRELAARPAMLTGAFLIAAGVILARVASGWLVRATPPSL